jgi:SAM-dependent MidA family methyltransferase
MTRPHTSLELKLIARIEHSGPMTFRDFMEAALYDREFGYYMTERPKIGLTGDYYTSSNVTSAFGTVVGRFLIKLLNQVCSTDGDLTIVELGAGTGQLAADILSAIREEHRSLYNRLTYVLIETSPSMRTRQREKLDGFLDRVKWCELSQLSRVVGLVLSNELFDALPVHIVRESRGRLEEVYVTTVSNHINTKPDSIGLSVNEELTGSSFKYVWGDGSTSEVTEYKERFASTKSDQLIEVGLDAVRLLSQISKMVHRGYVLTIDYGDLADHLYSQNRRSGTLRSFFRHTLVESPLTQVGEQDITASVNFSALIEYGSEVGLEPLSYERQVDFLTRNGLIEELAAMDFKHGGSVDALRERLAVKNLLVPGGISDNFRVLVQKKLPQEP